MAYLTIDNISKTYYTKSESVEVLRDISFTVEKEEFVTVVGPSGCGKSTLLNVLAGLLAPTSGSVMLGGEELSGPDPRLGYVTQRDTLLPWRTLMENVEFVLEIRGVSKQERRLTAQELIDTVDLSGFENRYPHELSGGMRQRAMIIRSLAYDPDLLLLDEPFGAVDAQTRGKLQNLVQDLHARTRKTMIFITHDLQEAVALADRVIVLTQRPTSVKATHTVNLERPRNVFRVGSDPEYQRILARVTDEVLETAL